MGETRFPPCAPFDYTHRSRPERDTIMWYFSWILGVGLAVTFGILNGMWFEFKSEDDPDFEDPFKD